MAQHTPGPWFVVPYGDHSDYVVCSDTKGDFRICFMATPGTQSTWHGIFANARLIATAPQLLEALENLTANLEHAFPALANLEPLKSARAAIAKAKGSAQ